MDKLNAFDGLVIKIPVTIIGTVFGDALVGKLDNRVFLV